MHTPNKPNPRKTNPTQKAPNTAHCRQSVKQTAQRTGKVVEHTVPNKNRSRALNAMRSTRGETKGNTESRARNARRVGNVTKGKSGEQRATKRENGTGGGGGLEMSGGRRSTKRENATDQKERSSG